MKNNTKSKLRLRMHIAIISLAFVVILLKSTNYDASDHLCQMLNGTNDANIKNSIRRLIELRYEKEELIITTTTIDFYKDYDQDLISHINELWLDYSSDLKKTGNDEKLTKDEKSNFFSEKLKKMKKWHFA